MVKLNNNSKGYVYRKKRSWLAEVPPPPPIRVVAGPGKQHTEYHTIRKGT